MKKRNINKFLSLSFILLFVCGCNNVLMDITNTFTFKDLLKKYNLDQNKEVNIINFGKNSYIEIYDLSFLTNSDYKEDNIHFGTYFIFKDIDTYEKGNLYASKYSTPLSVDYLLENTISNFEQSYVDNYTFVYKEIGEGWKIDNFLEEVGILENEDLIFGTYQNKIYKFCFDNGNEEEFLVIIENTLVPNKDIDSRVNNIRVSFEINDNQTLLTYGPQRVNKSSSRIYLEGQNYNGNPSSRWSIYYNVVENSPSITKELDIDKNLNPSIYYEFYNANGEEGIEVDYARKNNVQVSFFQYSGRSENNLYLRYELLKHNQNLFDYELGSFNFVVKI